MAERDRTSRRRRSAPAGIAIRGLALAALVALASGAPGPASAQDEDVIGSVSIQTTLGTFFIELEEDNPSVRPFARAFASMVKNRTFFHESDKTIGCDAEDENCFVCACNFDNAVVNACGEAVGVCEGKNPLPCTNTTPEFRVKDQTVESRVLHAGLLELDGGNNLVQANNSLAPLDTTVPGVFANNPFTVAFVRDSSGDITPEWIINLQDNSELLQPDGVTTFDDEDNPMTPGARAYFVIGQLGSGSSVVAAIAGLIATDARCNYTLLPETPPSVLADLEQLPVIDNALDVEGPDTNGDMLPDPDGQPDLVEFCNEGDAGYPGCLEPLCIEVSEDELSCVDPFCYEVFELDAPVGGSDFACSFPVDPNFPLIAFADPAGVTLVANGLAPPEPTNLIDFPNNPQIIVDVRNVGCFVDEDDPPGVCTSPGSATFLQVAPGGSVSLLRASDSSRAIVTGGVVDAIELYDDAQAILQGGDVPLVTSTDSSDVALQGGIVDSWVSQGDSTGLLTGGDPLALDVQETSFIRIVGSGFSDDMGPLAPGPVADLTGTLTGTLASGEMLDLAFDQADVGQIHLLSVDAMQTPQDAVTVGDRGNAADPVTGFGAVAVEYRIGQTEVSNDAYAEFLNAVAKSDPYDLYDTRMETDSRGGIARNGGQGNYSYQTITGRADWPVVFVSRFDAMRYANWLHNGKPVGASDPAEETEDGAYLFVDGVLQGGRQPGGRYFVPTRDEWYKAAYYDPATSTYFAFPTSSNTQPTTQPPTRDIGNGLNAQGALATVSPLSDAGAYAFSVSPNGTLDQGGNVVEWLEDTLALRGGHWNVPGSRAERAATPVTVADADAEENFLGFRLVPEPSGNLLAIAAFTAIASLRRRRRTV